MKIIQPKVKRVMITPPKDRREKVIKDRKEILEIKVMITPLKEKREPLVKKVLKVHLEQILDKFQ